MTAIWAVLAALMVSRNPAPPTITVYLAAEGTAMTSAATSLAGSTFRKAGMTIVWQRHRRRSERVPSTWLPVRLVDEAPMDGVPASLAVSYPYAGCSRGITVYLNRIREVTRGTDRESALLAYVLVHEIGHVVQGIGRHSASGVMKASWDERDRAAIYAGRLGFEDVDVQLMRRGLPGGCGERATLTDPFEPGSASRPE